MKTINIAVFCEDLYEELELWYPYYRLKEEGFNVFLVGPEKREYKGKHGYPAKTEKQASEITSDEIDGIIIPGGFAPDKLRRSPHVVDLVKKVCEGNKVVAAICHGPWVLISANILRNKRATSSHAIRDDVVNAGAGYVDEAVVVDGNIITSRAPADLPAFVKAVITALKG